MINGFTKFIINISKSLLIVFSVSYIILFIINGFQYDPQCWDTNLIYLVLPSIITVIFNMYFYDIE